LLFLVSLSSCDWDERCRTIGGDIETRELFLPEVEGIALEIPTLLRIRQDAEQEIVLTGNADLLDYLENRIENGIWVVGVPGCYRGGDQLLIEASLQQIRFLGISGAGEVVSENFLQNDVLELALSGAGSFDIGAEVNQLRVDVSGEGGVFLEGAADRLDYRLSGSGNLNAFELKAREVIIRISGSGNADVTVTELLDVGVSGVGNIRFKGNPPTVNQRISGVGTVTKVD
jgi:hypothetical protein